LVLLVVRWPWYVKLDREIGEVETVMAAARPGDVLVPILYAKGGRDSTMAEPPYRTSPILHAAPPFAGCRAVPSCHNHFAVTTFSPIMFANPNTEAMRWLIKEIESWHRDAPTFDLDLAQERTGTTFTLVLTWGAPPASSRVEGGDRTKERGSRGSVRRGRASRLRHAVSPHPGARPGAVAGAAVQGNGTPAGTSAAFILRSTDALTTSSRRGPRTGRRRCHPCSDRVAPERVVPTVVPPIRAHPGSRTRSPCCA